MLLRECETPLLWMGEDELREYARMLMRLLLTAAQRQPAPPLVTVEIPPIRRPMLASTAVH